MTPPQKRALNIHQLAAKLGNRSMSSLYRDFDSGRLPKPFKIGGRSYWWDHEIDAAIERQNTIAEY